MSLPSRLFWFAGAFLGVTLICQAQEQAPLVLGGFETQGSVTAGYRFTDIKGRKQKFLELFNLQSGFRLMDFNLFGRAKEGSSLFADSYSLSMSGLGGDPFPGGQLTVRKDKLYDLRASYRQSYFYWDRNDDAALPSGLHGLTSNHDWATVRRFASVNFTLHATPGLRFNFEYQRASRDGMTFTTRNLDYFGSPSVWGSFARANPYYVELPLEEAANRFTGGLDYTLRDWNFHYQLGYQTFEQNLTGNNVLSPQRSLNIDDPATAQELVSNISWQEFRRLKTPVSEFAYDGKVNERLEVRGSYLFYRYRGPASRDAAFNGSARTNSGGTAFAPYTVTTSDRAEVTEPNNVLEQGFSLRLKDWWNFHTDYRYARFTENSLGHYHSLRDGTVVADGDEESEWLVGTHLLDLNMEFIPSRALVLRTGVRLLKRDIEGLMDGVSDPVHTRRIKTAWPTLSVSYRPSKIFSVRGDFQSITSGASYTRISPHTDIGSRFVFRFQPLSKLSVEDNLVVRNRQFQDTNFRNNIRSNAFAVSYAFNERVSAFAGFSYESYFATDSVTFLRGTPPLTTVWSDQFINRVWQGGLSLKAPRYVGFNLSGNFVRTTGLSQISGEPPNFGPLTSPLITGTLYFDFPKAGRLSLDLQRTYYIEEIVRGNNFSGNLLTIRWTRDF
jgi:hypothetical protein